MSEQFNLAIDRKHTALVFVEARPELFRSDFREWLERNFSVWEAFEREANKVWASGRRHYSARTIGEYLRHETLLREAPSDPKFKLNDHFWPDLARLHMLYHEEREGFFEFRSGVSARRAA